jgi:uncharacterized YccA/Bax inhibitor family protein
MFDIISIDPVIFLIFVLPGFFFLKTIGIKCNSEFEHMILSFFWGVLLITLYYKFIPIEKFNSFIENPYLGAIIFSLLTIAIVFLLKLIVEFVRKIYKTF